MSLRAHPALHRKNQKLNNVEEVFLRRVRRQINQLVELIILEWADDADIDTVIVPQRLRLTLAERLRDMMAAALQAGAFEGQRDVFRARERVRGGALYARFTTSPGEPSPESIPYEGIDWYQSYSLELAGVYEQAVLDYAKDIIIASRLEGFGIAATADALMDALPTFAWHRLENIARTESARVYEQGKYITYTNTPGVVAYEIHAVIDARTTDICLARNGRIIPITAAGYEWPPYHYQCRTTTAAVLDIEIASGDVRYNPIPDNAPKPMRGFGTVLVPSGWKPAEY